MDGNILLKGKQSGILLALRDTEQSWYVSSLAKAAGTTYVHACNFINVCEDLDIVSCEKHGKLKVVKLTDKGAKMAEMIAGIKTLLASTSAPAQPQQNGQQPGPQQAAPKEKETAEKKQ